MQLSILSTEKYLIGENLSLLRIDHNGLSSQGQLTLLGLPLRTHHRNVVPDNVFVKVLLDQNDLLVQ